MVPQYGVQSYCVRGSGVGPGVDVGPGVGWNVALKQYGTVGVKLLNVVLPVLSVTCCLIVVPTLPLTDVESVTASLGSGDAE